MAVAFLTSFDSQIKQPRVPTVRFEDGPSTPEPIANRGAGVAWANSPTDVAQHFIEAGYHINHQPIVCLRYPPFESSVTVTFCNFGDMHRVSLKEILKVNSAVSLSATLSLAVELTRAVFYFQQAGLLHGILNSGNVYFSKNSKKILLGNLLLPVRAADPHRTGGHHDESNGPQTIDKDFGRVCLMLGIILVEILLGQEVSHWNQGADIIPPGTLQNALAALNEIRNRWGSKCSNAVKSCLVDFLVDVDRTEDWRDTEKVFQELVLEPLEDVLRRASPGRLSPKKIVLVEDWDRALNSSREGVSPVGLTEDYIKTSDLSDPTVLRVFRDNTQSMLETCENIRWLNEALSNEGMPQSG